MGGKRKGRKLFRRTPITVEVVHLAQMVVTVPGHGVAFYDAATNTLTLTRKVGNEDVRRSVEPNNDVRPRLFQAFRLASKGLPEDLIEILQECGLIEEEVNA